MASDCVASLGVLAEEGPIYSLIGHLNGADVCKEVELFSHSHVCAFDIRPRVTGAGRGGRSLEDHMAGLELREHIVGDRFSYRGAVFYGKSVDHLELDLSRCNTVGEKLLENGLRRFCYDRTDSVAAAYADHNLVKLIVIHKVGCRVDSFNALELTFEKVSEFFAGFFDLSIIF